MRCCSTKMTRGAGDLTAYAPELLIKMRYATENRNRKILRTNKKRQDLCCKAAVQCSEATEPFPKKTFCCLENTFLLKTRGWQRVGSLQKSNSAGESVWKQYFRINKLKTTSGTRRQELTSEGRAAAFCTAERHDITEATSRLSPTQKE